MRERQADGRGGGERLRAAKRGEVRALDGGQRDEVSVCVGAGSPSRCCVLGRLGSHGSSVRQSRPGAGAHPLADVRSASFAAERAPATCSEPSDAILNYLYTLLEAETVLACQTIGLDPGLGIFHADRNGRASFALDLMEAVRPNVDAYLLAVLRESVLSARAFAETRR
jgi:hypothetical protein